MSFDTSPRRHDDQKSIESAAAEAPRPGERPLASRRAMWEHLKATREARRVAGVDQASDRLMHHLAELERYQGLFLREAAHDLRNPLTAIRGHVQLVRRRLGRAASDGALPIDRISDSLTAIEAALERATELVEVLLERERPSAEPERSVLRGEAATGEAPSGKPADQAWSEPDKSTDG